MKSTKNNNS